MLENNILRSQRHANFADFCSFFEKRKSLFLQQLCPLTNRQQFQASVEYNVSIDHWKVCAALRALSCHFPSMGSMRLYRSCVMHSILIQMPLSQVIFSFGMAFPFRPFSFLP